MPLIHLTTFIQAPQQRVFDLSRSVDLHVHSMQHANEIAVGGVTSGLIGLHQSVTWQARHWFKLRQLTISISAMVPAHSFTDEMIQGDFVMMKHEHHFKPAVNGTIMIDLFTFQSPYGLVGALVDKIFMKRYLQKLLEKRNSMIKEVAETNKWKDFL